jgi:3'(2'),5'-bisphosphate nucleotidase
MTQPSPELLNLASIAQEAGRAIMDIYGRDFAAATKADSSPVTEADVAAEKLILQALAGHFPHIPVVAEEQAAAGHIPHIASGFFLVDPLDGTKEFISRNGEFTVNIGRIENGVPVSGVVYAPALNEMFLGRIGEGAFKAKVTPDEAVEAGSFTSIACRALPAEGATILASRSHRDAETEAFIATVKTASLISAGSSLKFCRLAEGKADLYPRFGRTMEWDTAAGHAVLLAAGGSMTKADGSPFTYGKADEKFANPSFIARGRGWRGEFPLH